MAQNYIIHADIDRIIIQTIMQYQGAVYYLSLCYNCLQFTYSSSCRNRLQFTFSFYLPLNSFTTPFYSLLYRFLSSVSADIAVVVYAVGIMEGNEEVWDYVWEQSRQTRVASEAEVMMNALAYTQEPWLLWRCVGY